MAKKLNVAILGSGNIGSDLLIKVLRSEYLNCSLFIGRNLSSPGIMKANSLGVRISDASIDAIIGNPEVCDLVFDATSALAHKKHAPVLKDLGIQVIDMTPSQIGKMCVPAINLAECVSSDNINMITCGGQTSVPIVHAMIEAQPDIDYVEIVSSIASNSAGPGTRYNIDEYIENTESGLRVIGGCENVKAIVILNPAKPPIDMQTTIFATAKDPDLIRLEKHVSEIAGKIRNYVPGYEIIAGPLHEAGRIIVMVRVRGLGDFLPSYAGNLDIINCAAIAAAEEFARRRNNEREGNDYATASNRK